VIETVYARLVSCPVLDGLPDKTHPIRSDPIRSIKKLADGILTEMSPVFGEVYAERGRASVPPERLF